MKKIKITVIFKSLRIKERICRSLLGVINLKNWENLVLPKKILFSMLLILLCNHLKSFLLRKRKRTTPNKAIAKYMYCTTTVSHFNL